MSAVDRPAYWALDFEAPRHAPSCAVLSTHSRPCDCGEDDRSRRPARGDVERLLCIEAAVLDLLRKVATHRRQRWTSITLGAFAALEAVVGDSHPHLLTTAERLDRLAVEPVDLPCDSADEGTGDEAA